jgi:hypothetical protein
MTFADRSTRSGAAVVAERMAVAASEWLASLDGTQRRAAAWTWPTAESRDERLRWFYTPTDHGGLPLGSMRPAQQRLAMRLVSTGLSEAGYVTVAAVMGLENVLDRVEGFAARFGRERGRDMEMYYLRVFGKPGAPTWAWRFGGHHVSLNNLVVDGVATSCTPCFIGANPADSPLLGGQVLRPLGTTEDLARSLVRSLDAEQTDHAIITPVPPTDIVGGNRSRLTGGELAIRLPDLWRTPLTDPTDAAVMEGTQRELERLLPMAPKDVESIRLSAVPNGIAAGDLSEDQRSLLRKLLGAYVDRAPDELAELQRDRLADNAVLDRVHFAWAGRTDPGAPHYYRVQGPRVLLEYDNVQDGINHTHTVWRDPEGDFGCDVLAEHNGRR